MKNRFFLIAIFACCIAFGITSCDKDDELPPIGGFNSSDEVGKANLVAHWPLNGNGIESKSSTAPTKTQGVTYETGAKGQGAKFASGFMSYPSIPALAGINGAISISAWVKITNQKAHPDSASAISPIFALTNPSSAVGNVAVFGNTHELATSDSIQMKAQYSVKKADGTDFNGDAVNMIRLESWMDTTHSVNANKIGGKWAHVVYRYYTDSNGTFNQIFVNGAKISNKAWEKRDATVIPFNQFTPTYPVIGALKGVAEGAQTDPWNKALNGSVDEIRVWSKSLTDAEILALYQLELAGR